MRRRFWISVILASLIIGFLVVGCSDGDSDNSDTENPPTETPQNETMPDITTAPEYASLQRQYTDLVAAHEAATTIWEGLGTGEQVQCGEPIIAPAPEDIPAADEDSTLAAIREQLRSAAIELDRAIKLWDTECSTARETIPPDIINEGRLATRAAGDALRQIENYFSASTP